MNIALIAHDKKKQEILHFTIAYKHILKNHQLFATGTTGGKITDGAGLAVHRFQSGPLGGDQQIGAKIANNEMDAIIFFRDPLTAQPHEPDVSALMRLCDVHLIPLATNPAAAEIMIQALARGDFEWRQILKHNRQEGKNI
ncbi:methylglyoxal synthase [Lentibacillus salicampi]|uniref:Methylglyoxal synthase n=1 Tax=Lentibacillus salicampi TaxID=175306 RepID=A0A4Y9AFS5_9BACI|nr:methylglyoxal synthase [Lentibacillus salicampi]TFJ93830.1 methylglyoxal synthase [Lentibacillus salicampi]